MANVPFTSTTGDLRKEILMFPNEYQAYPFTFNPGDPAAATINGRTIVQAGTIYPTNDAGAKGVVFYDCDVTDGSVTGAILFEASIKVSKLPEAPVAAAITALPRITFFPTVTP
jgi:hypothetical protein